MTCLHTNRTLLRCIARDESLIKTWRCDDCPHEWAEEVAKLEPEMQQCDGNCDSCPHWKEPESEVSP